MFFSFSNLPRGLVESHGDGAQWVRVDRLLVHLDQLLDQSDARVSRFVDSVTVSEESAFLGLQGGQEKWHVLGALNLLKAFEREIDGSTVKGTETGGEARDARGNGIGQAGGTVKHRSRGAGHLVISVQDPELLQSWLVLGDFFLGMPHHGQQVADQRSLGIWLAQLLAMLVAVNLSDGAGNITDGLEHGLIDPLSVVGEGRFLRVTSRHHLWIGRGEGCQGSLHERSSVGSRWEGFDHVLDCLRRHHGHGNLFPCGELLAFRWEAAEDDEMHDIFELVVFEQVLDHVSTEVDRTLDPIAVIEKLVLCYSLLIRRV